MNEQKLKSYTDEQLVRSIERLAAKEQDHLYIVLIHLEEFERRRLHGDCGMASLFEYCTEKLQMTRGESHYRISAMRLMRANPLARRYIKDKKLSLTGAFLLGTFFRDKEREVGSQLSNQERNGFIEKVRALPTREAAKMLTEKLGKRFRPAKKIVISDRLAKKIAQYQEIIGDYSEAEIFEILLTQELQEIKEGGKGHRTKRRISQGDSRYISKEVRNEVLQRSGNQCEYISKKEGRRCKEKLSLEFDHIVPFSLGGMSISENIRHYCRTHNQRAAIKTFGVRKMEKYLVRGPPSP